MCVFCLFIFLFANIDAELALTKNFGIEACNTETQLNLVWLSQVPLLSHRDAGVLYDPILCCFAHFVKVENSILQQIDSLLVLFIQSFKSELRVHPLRLLNFSY